MYPDFSKVIDSLQYSIGFEGSFGERLIGPRELYATYLNQMVCLEGIVTKTSLIHPKLVKTVHWCPKTMRVTTKTYQDGTDAEGRVGNNS